MTFDASQWPAYLATVFFVLALLHTFMVNAVLHLSQRFPKDSMRGSLLHFLAEIEIVFGFWAFLYLLVLSVVLGTDTAVKFLEKVPFTEPAFVFVIMCMAATKPVMTLAAYAIELPSKAWPKYRSPIKYFSILVIGPCLGSLITEPAAMTVTALLLKDSFLDQSRNRKFLYASLGLLFVNISIGGTLTHFAAPPVVMVADKWGWGVPFMMQNFGIKALVAIAVSSAATMGYFWKELQSIRPASQVDGFNKKMLGISLSHLVFIALCVLYHTKMAFFLPLFLIFLGWTEVTNEQQTPLKIRESLLVGFFLGGLVTLGNQQGWWLQPLLQQLSDGTLFLGTTALTALTDNAALTYLGSLAPSLSDSGKYFLVAGAVTGGGLTIVANAPNPAGYGIVKSCFGEEGISAAKLLLAAMPYTAIAAACYWFM